MKSRLCRNLQEVKVGEGRCAADLDGVTAVRVPTRVVGRRQLIMTTDLVMRMKIWVKMTLEHPSI